MRNDFLVIPADGSVPFYIPQFGSVNDTWHNLMRDPDRNLFFETVYCDSPFDDLVILVDECGKLRPHVVNELASLFYPGSSYGDYIAGTVLVARIGLVPYDCGDGEVIQEHDILPLLPAHVAYFDRIIDHYRSYFDRLWDDLNG